MLKGPETLFAGAMGQPKCLRKLLMCVEIRQRGVVHCAMLPSAAAPTLYAAAAVLLLSPALLAAQPMPWVVQLQLEHSMRMHVAT